MRTPLTNPIHILIVDDEPGIRNVLKITLEASGYRVCLADDGESGMDRFKNEQPDLIITDIKMPGIDGIELLKQIKQMSPDTEIIMITGHGDMDLAVKSLKHEAADFITKPIDSCDLVRAVKKAEERIRITRGIRDYMDDLENLIREKDKKLDESKTMATIGLTIAGMSHAIKNIAGGLKGSSFVLEQGIEQENREVLEQGWEMMKGNINKITKLSLDLLNYAKTTRLNIAPENPDTPAREIMHLLAPRAEELEIGFEFSPCREKILVNMDRDAVQACLLTLVTNAFDSFDSSLAPSFRQENRADRQVRLEVACDAEYITYCVRDNGCGINETITHSLFNDFISTKGMNGTGFGLMTTKKILDAHHGIIMYSPEKDRGSRFTIRLPRTKKMRHNQKDI